MQLWRQVIVGFRLPRPQPGRIMEGEQGRALAMICAECFALTPADLHDLHWERAHPDRAQEPPL